jgi:hypothetical protein
MDNIIWAVVFLGIGWMVGRSSQQSEQPDREQDKDFAYYKNLSESLLQDVRRLREEIRNLKNNNRF